MTNNITLGTITTGTLKDVWPGEATDFTPWLADNLHIFDEKIGCELVFENREHRIGNFTADIIATDTSTNRKVIIENQYGKTNHDHLGKILTYATNSNAGIVVWLAENFQPEHRVALDFLNQNLSMNDYLRIYAFEVSVIRIDQSKPALILNMVASPPTNIVAASSDLGASETKEKYRSFFQELIDQLRTIHHFTNARVAQPQNWYSFSSENSKLFKYSVNFTNSGKFKVEIYIDSGDGDLNAQLFEFLLNSRDEIDKEFDGKLSWEPLENRRACRIATYIDGSIDSDTQVLTDITKWAINNLLRLKLVFPKRIAKFTPNRSSQDNHNIVGG